MAQAGSTGLGQVEGAAAAGRASVTVSDEPYSTPANKKACRRAVTNALKCTRTADNPSIQPTKPTVHFDLGVSLWDPPSVSDLAILGVESLDCPAEWSHRTWFATLNSVNLQPGQSKDKRHEQLIQG